jgi:pilus assembly protein CpaC
MPNARRLISFGMAALVIFLPGASWGDEIRESEPVLMIDAQRPGQVRYLTWPTNDGISGGDEQIISGTSQVFRFDRPVIRAAVSSPDICDIVPISPQEILMHASGVGKTNFIVWDENNRVATYNVQATLDTDNLEKLLNSIDPDASIRIVPFRETVAVYGTTETAQRLQRMQEVTTVFDESAMNFVQVRDPKQILLEVHFAEVNRSDSMDFRIDAEMLSRFINFRTTTGQTGATDVSDPFTVGGVYPNSGVLNHSDYEVFNQNQITQSIANFALTYATGQAYVTPVLRWLETKNVLKLIARPNLIAKDGEEATFLVGGEFAIPVSNDGDISVEYQEFGTKLTFTPEILDRDLMRLKIATEVSELDFTNAVTISNTQVPSLLKREQSTVAELRDGQSLVIGGMITQRVNRILRKMPLISDIPVLGNLFKAENFTRADVELLVVITPHIVKPFETGYSKVFYDPERVHDATKVIYPMYEDTHSDAVHDVILQDEGYAYFDDIQQNYANGTARGVLNHFGFGGGNPQVETEQIAEPEPEPEAVLEPQPETTAQSLPDPAIESETGPQN